MSEEWIPLTYDEAVSRLALSDYDDDGTKAVHCYMNPNGMLLGADWQLDSVLACLKSSADADELAEGGPLAKAMKHGVRAMHSNSVDGSSVVVWFETKESSHD